MTMLVALQSASCDDGSRAMRPENPRWKELFASESVTESEKNIQLVVSRLVKRLDIEVDVIQRESVMIKAMRSLWPENELDHFQQLSDSFDNDYLSELTEDLESSPANTKPALDAEEDVVTEPDPSEEGPSELIEVVDMQIGDDDPTDKTADVQMAARRSISRRCSVVPPSRARLSAKFAMSGVQTALIPTMVSIGVQVDPLELGRNARNVSFAVQASCADESLSSIDAGDGGACVDEDSAPLPDEGSAPLSDEDSAPLPVPELEMDTEHTSPNTDAVEEMSALAKEPECQQQKKPRASNNAVSKSRKRSSVRHRQLPKQRVVVKLDDLPANHSDMNASNYADGGAEAHGGLRRSKRQRFPVLKFWKNETVVYSRRDSQVMPSIAELVELENDSSPELISRRQRRRNTKTASSRAPAEAETIKKRITLDLRSSTEGRSTGDDDPSAFVTPLKTSTPTKRTVSDDDSVEEREEKETREPRRRKLQRIASPGDSDSIVDSDAGDLLDTLSS